MNGYNTGSLNPLKKELRRIRPLLRKNGGYRLYAAATALIGEELRAKVSFLGEEPLVASVCKELSEYTTESVENALLPYTEKLTNADFLTLMWQIRYCSLKRAAKNSSENELIHTIADIDFDYLSDRYNPLERKYSSDETYLKSDRKTRALYRDRTTGNAQLIGVSEERLSTEYIKTAARSGSGLGEIIWQDYRRIHPFTTSAYYIIVQTAFAVALTAAAAALSGWLVGLSCFAPALAVSKTVIDSVLLRYAKKDDPPAVKRSEAEKHTAVCVLSALTDSEEAIEDAVGRIRKARLKNNSRNIKWCILCDLPVSHGKESRNDRRIIRAAKELSESSKDAPVIIFRNREFSKTQQMFQGRERKRGAIEDLARYINGEDIEFREVFGDTEALRGAEFMCTLDYDTLPLMDSINSLIAAAVHPVNADYGIFVPRITTSLSSSLRTVLSRFLGGVGGCSTASVYDSVSSELYYNCFGEGTFTGKGLIRIKEYCEKCIGAFPEERVLSHDILEGGLMNTAYCGSVEFSDSFPPTVKGYFKRLHRWTRGDFQNFFFVFDSRFSPLLRFKLSDNIRRALTPLYAVMTIFTAAIFSTGVESFYPVTLSLLSVTLPYLIGLVPAAIKGLGFSNTREFYAPISSLSRRLVFSVFWEMIFLVRGAVMSLDALIRTVWRLITGRKLLEWTTASSFDKVGARGYGDIIASSLIGILLFGISVYTANIYTAIVGIFFSFILPAAIVCDKAFVPFTPYIKEKDRAALLAEAEKQWQFYVDYVTEAENFLPPDNVQHSPVYLIAHRTSPTNIGMYLLSCVCACELGLIDKKRAECFIGRTLETVEKLPKYKGNLYNWYETDTLKALGDFVSSVDSGNFLCCLVAVRRALTEYGADEAVIGKITALIENADITIFYNRPRKLFSTGVSAKTGKIMPNCYDMLMSEARMFSFFAIATGKADRSHWRALSRLMSRSGYYAGPVAWTGTMFEYFMPELLLESKKGSLCYEALGYAVYCQRERGRERKQPFGISESAYFAFDRELSYQYKAHGVQKLALCDGMDKEYVISPYSSFLALSHSFSACMKNLSRLITDGFSHERYGLYEAIDFTDKRTGGADAVIKSHMAHHIGMSLGGITNALCGGRLRELFMSDEKMQRADELLEERVMSGEVVIDMEKIREKPEKQVYSEEYTDFNVLRPRINIVANHKLAVFSSDTGLYSGRFGDKATAVPPPDFLRRPKGMFFGVNEVKNGEVTEIPFYLTMYDDSPEVIRSVVFEDNVTKYYADYNGLDMGMKLSLYGENAAEIREIAVRNEYAHERKLCFYGYIEPALAFEKEIEAHPAFADMFIKEEYDEKERLIFAYRKERHSDKETVMCIGFSDFSDFSYTLCRENVLSYGKPLDFTKVCGENRKDGSSVPSPCVYISLEIALGAEEKYNNSLFICYGNSKNEVIGIVNDIRGNVKTPTAVSPLPKSTLQGQIASRALPAILYKNVYSEELLGESSGLDTRLLDAKGIRTDLPTIITRSDGDEAKTEAAVRTVRGLCACGIETQLVILCENEADKRKAEYIPVTGGGVIVPIVYSSLTEHETELLYKSAVYLLGKTEERKPPERIMEIIPCESGVLKGRDGFYEDSYIISEKGHPKSNVIASQSFGTVVSQNSLGFTYALNSRENKLTPWYNDVMNDNNGEMLLIKGAGVYYDIIGGARAVFSPNKADYYGKTGKLSLKTEVRVFSKGMGKSLTVFIENPSDIPKQCAISYYCEPIMGADRSRSNYGSALVFTRDENAVYCRNRYNPEFKGEMAVYCDREIVATTNREQFLAGEQNGEIRAFASPCIAVTSKVKIPPNTTEKITFIVAYSRSSAGRMVKALQNIGVEWNKERSPIIKSRSDTQNRLYNTWLPWQTVGCRMWARSAFYQNGGAYGFRDQLQDSLAAIYYMPAEAKRQILRCCASQFPEGDVLHWWHRINGKRKGARMKCSDDMLWLPFVTAKYCEKTGDYDILSLSVQYVTGSNLGSSHEKYIETDNSAVRSDVYTHCKKALEKGYRTGSHSLIKIGSGDWNDGYNNVGIEGRGESVWLSMFYVWIVKEFAPIARKYGDLPYADELEKRAARLTEAIEEDGYENGYFLRAYYDDGRKMGAKGNEACEIDLLPQAFATLAGLPDKAKNESALRYAKDKLVDPERRIISLFIPPFERGKTAENAGYIASYPKGIRENGGQYTHAAIWLALAFLRAGDRETAKTLADYLNPAERGKEFRNEPYYMTADIYTNPECIGRGGWSLYTGAAAWYWILLDELYGGEK